MNRKHLAIILYAKDPSKTLVHELNDGNLTGNDVMGKPADINRDSLTDVNRHLRTRKGARTRQ